MAATIPNLWPEDQIKVDVLSPLVILRTQASNLSRMTQGLVVGDVSVETSEEKTYYHFDLVAPALDYRHRMFSFYHHHKTVYPVYTMYGASYGETFDGTGLMVEIPVTASTEADFVRILREILGSNHALSIIQSLIASSNEARGEEAFAEAA